MPKMCAVLQEVLAAAGCHLGSGDQVTTEFSETPSTELLSKPQGAVQIQTASLQNLKGWLWLSLHYILTFFLPFCLDDRRELIKEKCGIK